MKRHLSYIVLAGLVLGHANSWAASDYPSTPKAVMERYLQLDADAAGLSVATWPELGQFTTFAQAPKWETFVVIDRYELGKILEGHTRAQVKVTYFPIGTLSDKFVANSAPELVVFFLNKVHNQWKVDSPPLMPHVAFEVMKKRLKNDALAAQITAARGR